MRIVVGLLLVTAAVLKAGQLIDDPTAALTISLGGWVLPIQVGVELGFGLLVLSGIFWRRVCWVALILFAAFSAYSLFLVFGGAASCGCFGPIEVHPWWTFMLDVAILVGLLISIGRSQNVPEPATCRDAPFWPGHSTVVAVIVGVVVVSSALLVRYVASRTAMDGNLLATSQNLVILEPARWVGQKLPIMDFIDLDISQGNWIVLLHRRECPDCQVIVPYYDELAKHNCVALVQVPPYGEPDTSILGPAKRGRLSNDREWFVQTPVEIQLVDGTVTSASTKISSLSTSTEN
jgi:hypothetical protein